MARNAFISWWKMFVRLESVFENAPDDCAGKALKESFVYARTGEVPELDPVSLILFSAIRPSIDDSAETFENISKRNRENGKNGGRPPKKSSTHELAETQNNPENPNNPEKTEDRSKKKEVRSKKKEVRSEKIEDRERKADKPPRPRFTPPSEDEAINYFDEQGSSAAEAKSFLDYYAAIGWKVGGRATVKNWQAAARNWIHRAGQYSHPQTKQVAAEPATDTISRAAERLASGNFSNLEDAFL